MTAVTVGSDGTFYLANPAPWMDLVTGVLDQAPDNDPLHHDSLPRTVLVVDDEEVVRLLIARALAEAGYGVVEASHGAGALALIESRVHDLDLVLCDLVMPGLNGHDLARWLAAYHPELPILLISGYPLPYLEAHDLYDPSLPLLRKPFLPSKLLEAVEETLPSVSARSPSST